MHYWKSGWSVNDFTTDVLYTSAVQYVYVQHLFWDQTVLEEQLNATQI